MISGLFISSSYFVHKVMFIPHISYSFAEVIISNSALYRALLTVSTILIFGGGFCSHLCFLGPWEKGTGVKSIFKYIFLVLFVMGTSSLIFFSANFFIAVSALSFFILSLAVIGISSIFTKKRTHCSILCPLASLREVTNRVSPFKIETSDSENLACPFGASSGGDNSLCLKCTSCITSGQSSISFFNYKKNAFEIFIVSIVITHGLFINLYRF
ncbi:4Fe-4S binding protein [Myxococcota bacterium]|nr:4Fe-4S binding protein [Myxococcota bacterium]